MNIQTPTIKQEEHPIQNAQVNFIKLENIIKMEEPQILIMKEEAVDPNIKIEYVEEKESPFESDKSD